MLAGGGRARACLVLGSYRARACLVLVGGGRACLVGGEQLYIELLHNNAT